MPVELQVKLLRVLETQPCERVGGGGRGQVDVRVIAATNREPEQAVADGKLREDLLYRLNVFPIALPPLRERGDDVELLGRALPRGAQPRERGPAEGLRPRGPRSAAQPQLARQRARAAQRRAARLHHGRRTTSSSDALPLGEPRGAAAARASWSAWARRSRGRARLILATLEHCAGDKKKAAEILGISLKTLYNRLNVYGAS